MGAANDFYHSESTAGGGVDHGTADDAYHPYCNCQIAIIFKKRGRLVARDPETGSAIPYDGKELVGRYEAIGSPTYSSKAGGVSRSHNVLSTKAIGSYASQIEGAKTLDELYSIANDVEKAVPKRAKQSTQWKVLQRTARDRRRILQAELMSSRDDDIIAGRSLSAAAKRDRVKIPKSVTGLSRDVYVYRTEGTDITGVHTMFGKGTGKKIKDEMIALKKEHPEVPESEWMKRSGNGFVDDLGISRKAHLHWCESEQTGRVRMKVDHFLR